MSQAFVERVVRILRGSGLEVWVFGGWAEELLGLERPRPHRDVDLVYVADDFSAVDALDFDWIAAKRFPWKRAFMLEGAMVELFLVRRDERGWFTEFERGRWDWPADVVADRGACPVASAAAVTGYRREYRSRDVVAAK